jgi:hypothetical protein
MLSLWDGVPATTARRAMSSSIAAQRGCLGKSGMRFETLSRDAACENEKLSERRGRSAPWRVRDPT